MILDEGRDLPQRLDRDTQKFAFKCSAIKRNNTWYPVQKDPITAPQKKSKSGLLKLIRVNSSYRTVKQENSNDLDVLQTVFDMGSLTRNQSLDQIRRILGTFE